MGRILGLVILAAGMLIAAVPAAARASSPNEVSLSGDAFFPESITAAPNGALFVSSLTTGEIVRLAPVSRTQTTFVEAGVNVGTAGVMVDPRRDVLWACAVDLSGQTPSELRAFDLRTGALRARYAMPVYIEPDVRGVCADITLARGDLYVTDTLGDRILRLTTPDPNGAEGGWLTVWSSLPDGPAFPGINGIAFDGRQTLYTTNYSTGELFAVRIGSSGAAEPAVSIVLDTPLINPDGIRWHAGSLYVADNVRGLVRVDPRTGTATAINKKPLDQPSSLVFVGEDDVWITEGQILRLQANQEPNSPFKVVRRRI